MQSPPQQPFGAPPQQPPPPGGGFTPQQQPVQPHNPPDKKLVIGVLAGCGCIFMLMMAGIMIAMIVASKGDDTARPIPPPITPPAPPTAPAPQLATGAAPADLPAVQYALAAGQAILAAARGEAMDPRFGTARTQPIAEVVALGPNAPLQMVVLELDGYAGGRHNLASVLVAYPDGRLRAAKMRLGRGRRRRGFDASVAPELHGLLQRFGNDMLQRGRCPHLLEPADVAGLPAPLVADLTRELGTTRSECRGLRSWPGFQAPWSAHVDDITVAVGPLQAPVIIRAQWRPRSDHLAISRVRLPRSRRRRR